MKLKFKRQQFQTEAVAAVVDLFEGQPRRQDTFTINAPKSEIDEDHVSTGHKNALALTNERIVANMQNVQRRNSLPITGEENTAEGESGQASRLHFNIEMETGTGKTYVYTKTIFELNQEYNFTKFIIVVPSVAIREGVYKSLMITSEHFARDYDNEPNRYFIYNSKDLSNVRTFATSKYIEIMVINIDAFKNKEKNIFYQEHEKLSGNSAIKLIQDTNPIVIIDEPQSVDNTPLAKDAIESLNPLCVLRYSATHKEKINLLYRLTPVEAYEKGLVKQICVSSNEVDSDFNRPYIRLVSVSHENGFSAKIEIDKADKGEKITRKTVTIKPNTDLFTISGSRDLYKGYQVVGIDCTPGLESIEFADGSTLAQGKAIGNIDENIIKRVQIRRTIECHFEKEMRFFDRGIKVLSLFFIDEVGKYRTSEGEQGVYAKMFEECYTELLALPKFAALRERFNLPVGSVHDGYFSQDKKGNYKNTKGDTLDDYDTYNVIMRDKELLLSFDCPLRFIWSHSALKEGWDNPNVFQVCTLIEQKSTFTARQKVGRGLRLCVNQDGERIEDKNVNILHVMANESFAEFADKLQREIEQETGIKFGVLQLGLFSGVSYKDTVSEVKTVSSEEAKIIAEYVQNLIANKTEKSETAETIEETPLPQVAPAVASVIKEVVTTAKMGTEITPEKVAKITYIETKEVEKTVTHEEAQELITHFEEKGYISKSGVIKETMKQELAAGKLDIPARFEAAREQVEMIISNANKKVVIRDRGKEVCVRLKKEVLISPEFLELWDRIKAKTSYRVKIDEEQLKEKCIEKLREMEHVQEAQIVTRTAKMNVEQSGVTHTETHLTTTKFKKKTHRLPNFLRAVDNECFLAGRTVVDILSESGKLDEFLNNPQKFIEMFIETVKEVQESMEIKGIKYTRLEGKEYYLQDVFADEELLGYLNETAISVDNSVYDHVLYDSNTVELPFAKALDEDPDVRLFFKIPPKFKIETPIGTYNPDWAVYMDKDGIEKLYFVIETKGTTKTKGLRGSEYDRILCGERHFAALESGVVFPNKPVKCWREFKKGV